MQTPEGFRHSIPMSIRFGDMDTLGHVNNAKYLTYMEQARITYFNELKLWDGDKTELGLIMAKAVIEYKLPLTMYDEIRVFTRVSRLGNKSFDTEQWIVRADGQVASTGVITIVVFDYTANASRPIPDDWRQRLIAYEPGLAG